MRLAICIFYKICFGIPILLQKAQLTSTVIWLYLFHAPISYGLDTISLNSLFL